jgi:hypothetical protein
MADGSDSGGTHGSHSAHPASLHGLGELGELERVTLDVITEDGGVRRRDALEGVLRGLDDRRPTYLQGEGLELPGSLSSWPLSFAFFEGSSRWKSIRKL